MKDEEKPRLTAFDSPNHCVVNMPPVFEDLARDLLRSDNVTGVRIRVLTGRKADYYADD